MAGPSAKAMGVYAGVATRPRTQVDAPSGDVQPLTRDACPAALHAPSQGPRPQMYTFWTLTH
ncbi:hypothetical protein MPL3365_80043 [Mesorhizobium plurifarium]|uniref:Uncharacterized protein n=1 Tax=Mesorhizobium plurifarium TaxID=69974 RepID=A0A090GD79_MESPL|nr:hypothetical protein MPL3365_80043 [Mesorhizobium plurifarium]